MSTHSTPRRLVRRTDDRVVAGVAGGVADALDVDPVLVRIGFVVFAFAAGAGIVAYIALWLLTPEVAGGEVPVAGANERGPAFWIAIGLFVLAALAIADSVADRSVVWPLVLVGAGVALWRSDGTRRASSPRQAPAAPWTGPPADPTAPAAPPAFAVGDDTGGQAPSQPPASGTVAAPAGHATAAAAPVEAAPPAAAPTQPMPAWTPPPPPGARPPGAGGHGGGRWRPPPVARHRSVLGRLTLGLVLVVLGALAVLDAIGVLDLTVHDAFAVALLVVGLGLVVGTWVGRARWLTLPAILLLVPGLVLSTVIGELEAPLGTGIGERSAGVTGPADVDPVYELGAGEMTLNFGELDLTRGDVATSVRLGVGQATVVVPDDATVDLTWELAGGRVDLFGQHRVGRAVQGAEVFPGDEDAGTLTLDVRATFGRIEIVRAGQARGRLPTGNSFDGVELGGGWPPALQGPWPSPRADPALSAPLTRMSS